MEGQEKVNGLFKDPVVEEKCHLIMDVPNKKVLNNMPCFSNGIDGMQGRV